MEVPGPKWQHHYYFDCELTLVAHGRSQFYEHDDDGTPKKSGPGIEKNSILINVSNMSNSSAQNFGKKSAYPLSTLDRLERGPSRSCPIKVPCVRPEYVDPGSDVGRYEKAKEGFLGSRFRVCCCKEAEEGGPGRISVARLASPSR